MREAEVGVGLKQRLHALRHIRAIADVAHQRMVECLHRVREAAVTSNPWASRSIAALAC